MNLPTTINVSLSITTVLNSEPPDDWELSKHVESSLNDLIRTLSLDEAKPDDVGLRITAKVTIVRGDVAMRQQFDRAFYTDAITLTRVEPIRASRANAANL